MRRMMQVSFAVTENRWGKNMPSWILGFQVSLFMSTVSNHSFRICFPGQLSAMLLALWISYFIWVKKYFYVLFSGLLKIIGSVQMHNILEMLQVKWWNCRDADLCILAISPFGFKGRAKEQGEGREFKAFRKTWWVSVPIPKPLSGTFER